VSHMHAGRVFRKKKTKNCIHNTGTLQCRKYTLPGMHMWSLAAESRGALVMPMGTMESTRDKGWTWILMAPMADVQKAGVHFDPNARTAKAIQGDTASRSALEVCDASHVHYVQ